MNRVSYKVVAPTTLTHTQIESLVLLYQPVFAFPALSLYLSLLYHAKHHDEIDLRELKRMLFVDTQQLDILRHELERFSLIRTFDDEGHLTLVLQEPLTPKAFMNHVTFGRLYAVVMGNDAFIEINNRYEEYDDVVGDEISMTFDVSRLASWSTEDEDKLATYSSTKSNYAFDVDRFFAALSSVIFPNEMRTQSVLELVEVLGSQYQVSFRDMRSKLLAASNFETKTIDEQRLRVSIEKSMNHQSVKSVSDPYELDAISFLAYKQNHDYIADADGKLIQSLQKNIGLPDDVINVLIEYVLDSNNNNLSKNYVEKIATTWRRKGIDNKDKAKLEIQKPSAPARPKAVVKSEAKMPEYSKDTTIDDDVELYRKQFEDYLKGGNS